MAINTWNCRPKHLNLVFRSVSMIRSRLDESTRSRLDALRRKVLPPRVVDRIEVRGIPGDLDRAPRDTLFRADDDLREYVLGGLRRQRRGIYNISSLSVASSTLAGNVATRDGGAWEW